MEFNLADLWERVVDAAPDAEAMVCGDRRLTFAAADERVNRLAHHLQAAGIGQLPLYPEARACRRPTTEHILRLFSLAERVSVLAHGDVVRVFPPQLTDLQQQVLNLLGVPRSAYLGLA